MSDQNHSEEIVVLITAPGEDEAAGIARALVEAGLAACVNIAGGIRSIYSWQGNIEDDKEVLMVVKTKRRLFDDLAQKVKELHGYEVPEIIALPIVTGLPDYLQWITDSTK